MPFAFIAKQRFLLFRLVAFFRSIVLGPKFRDCFNVLTYDRPCRTLAVEFSSTGHAADLSLDPARILFATPDTQSNEHLLELSHCILPPCFAFLRKLRNSRI